LKGRSARGITKGLRFGDQGGWRGGQGFVFVEEGLKLPSFLGKEKRQAFFVSAGIAVKKSKRNSRREKKNFRPSEGGRLCRSLSVLVGDTTKRLRARDLKKHKEKIASCPGAGKSEKTYP